MAVRSKQTLSAPGGRDGISYSEILNNALSYGSSMRGCVNHATKTLLRTVERDGIRRKDG